MEHCAPVIGSVFSRGGVVDSKHFDRLTRLIGTRRMFALGLGAATVLNLTDTATARKKNRKDCKKPAIRLRCNGNTCGKQKFKMRDDLNCELTPTPCASIADCPSGRACAETPCGPGDTIEKRCVPLCHPTP